GTITGLYTVLVDGDDMTDPIADSVRSILDGHVVLSRRLAERDHYPAIDVLASVSRVMRDVTSPAHQRAAFRIRPLLAADADAEDLIPPGAYAHGSEPEVDAAIARMDAIDAFLRQGVEERSEFEETLRRLEALAASGGAPVARFTFRLETVYRWKQWQEEAARDQWVQAHRRLNQARAELLLLESELGALGERLPGGVIDGSTLQAWAQYAARTREEEARQQEEVSRAE